VTELNVKGKGVPVHSMKAYGEVEVSLHSFSTVALDVCELSASHPGGLTKGGGVGGTPWYPMSMSLGGYRKQSGCFGEKRIY
jgi:hypothetical protein